MTEPRWTRTGLARFRADPEKVKVGIRRFRGGWLATVCERKFSAKWHAYRREGRTPRAALFRALHAAARAKVDGVDLDMSWAYPHPYAPRSRTGT